MLHGKSESEEEKDELIKNEQSERNFLSRHFFLSTFSFPSFCTLLFPDSTIKIFGMYQKEKEHEAEEKEKNENEEREGGREEKEEGEEE